MVPRIFQYRPAAPRSPCPRSQYFQEFPSDQPGSGHNHPEYGRDSAAQSQNSDALFQFRHPHRLPRRSIHSLLSAEFPLPERAGLPSPAHSSPLRPTRLIYRLLLFSRSRVLLSAGRCPHFRPSVLRNLPRSARPFLFPA